VASASRSASTASRGAGRGAGAGVVVAVVGASGSGGSTPLDVHAGTDVPSAGRAPVAGHEIAPATAVVARSLVTAVLASRRVLRRSVP